MPPHKFTYDLPSNEEPSVLREDGIEYGFIGRLQGLIGDQAVPVQCIEDDAGNGYVWHTTGSGKTLTSFNASTLLKLNEHIHKCLFVVDRKDRGEANISRDIGGRATGQFRTRRFISSN